MERLLLTSIATVLALTSCNKSDTDHEMAKRCERAVAKVGLEELQNSATGKPSAQEQAIMDGVRTMTVAKCQSEGLTKEQAACLDKINNIESLFEAADCPAIAAKKPSWFQVPPPEVRKEALEQMRAKKAEDAKQ